MLLTYLRDVLGLAQLSEARHASLLSFSSLQLILAAYALWWLWRFKIVPLIHPSEPRQYPYWIPFLGHARSFFRDSQALLTNARKYFDDSREPFTLTIAGAELYIITNPQDMSLVYKSTESLAFDDFIRDLHVRFGMSAYGRETMWDDTAGKCLVHQANDIHHAQLHPGEHLDDLTQEFLGQIERRLRPDMVFPGKDSRNSGTPKQARLSLYDLCSDVLVPAASVALFGEALLRTSPTLVDDFHSFDEDSWMLTYQYPRLLARKMHQAMERNTNALTKYFQLPLEDRPGACYYVKTFEALQREASMKIRDLAITIHLFYWVYASGCCPTFSIGLKLWRKLKMKLKDAFLTMEWTSTNSFDVPC